MHKTLSHQLAEFTVNLKFKDLPTSTVRLAVLSFLDWLGSGIRGGRESPGRIVREMVAEMGGNPQATILTTGERSSALGAALVNGVSSHILELDDVHKASIFHPAAPVMPAALAAAELVQADGKKLIEGIVAGYEVGIRIGEAVTPSHYKKWHTTGTCGTFGAAAAAGKILNLNVEEMVHALGNAGSQAAGLWEFIEDGAMTKHLHPGKAAMNGLLSAILASKGFTGARRILEGKRGFFVSTAKEYDVGKVVAGLGNKYKIEENCFKIHSSCRHTHAALDVVIGLAERENIIPAEVASVKAGVYRVALDIVNNPDPKTVYAAKFSLPFCLALGLVKRKAGLEDFSLETLSDPVIREVMKKIKIEVDPELESMYPERWPVRVTIGTKRGTFKGKTDYPKGDPENPVSGEDLKKKFYDLVLPVLDEEKVRSIVKSVINLPEARSPQDVLKWLAKN